MKKYFFISILLAGLFPLQLNSQILIGNTEVDTASIVSGLDTPWEILWGPDDHIWMTERFGRVSRFDPETGELKQILDISNTVHEQSEAGLLGMALDPGFESNNRVYLVYNYLDGSNIKERLVRYIYEGGELVNETILLDDIGGSGNHNGSRIAFGSEGNIFLTTGDAVNASQAQDKNSLNGKILRINPDGSIPSDNPDPASYIWTLGHRNPQGLVFSPSDILYSSEHGPSNDDEMNIIEKGRNYGWPDVQGYCNDANEIEFCNTHNVKEPIAAWTPTLATAGIDYYDHSSIPEWQNSIIMTTLKASRVVVLNLSGDGMSVDNQVPYFQDWWGRLRDVCVSPDGRIFISTSNRDGRGDVDPGDDRIIELKASPSTSIKKENSPMLLYPNPVVDGVLRIKNNWSAPAVTMRVYDSSGQLVDSYRFNNAPNELKLDMDYKPGIYFIEIINGSDLERKKVVLN